MNKKRLRFGVSLWFAKNALVLAADVPANLVTDVQAGISVLGMIGWRDGKTIGSGFASGTIVARVEDN